MTLFQTFYWRNVEADQDGCVLHKYIYVYPWCYGKIKYDCLWRGLSWLRKLKIECTDWPELWIKKKAKIRNQQNQVPHSTQNTIGESDKCLSIRHKTISFYRNSVSWSRNPEITLYPIIICMRRLQVLWHSILFCCKTQQKKIIRKILTKQEAQVTLHCLPEICWFIH